MRTRVARLLILVLVFVLHGSTPFGCEKCSASERPDGVSALPTKPASCSLSPTEYSGQVSEIGLILAKRQAMRELDNGYAFQFPGDDADLVSRLTRWIVAERQCCTFLQFELTFAADQGPIWVSVVGSQEVKELVSSLLETVVTPSDR